MNVDLKKLLVASVGDDLHHKVEAIVRSVAHDVGGFLAGCLHLLSLLYIKRLNLNA